jgi:hypothetical protein
METERAESLQAVVDRVSSYQDGAPEGTVEQELRKGFAETGLDVTDDELATLVGAIEENPGHVPVAELLA